MAVRKFFHLAKLLLGAGMVLLGTPAVIHAQQQSTSSWPATGEQGTLPDPGRAKSAPAGLAPAPRSSGEGKGGASQVTLVALLTQDGQRIDQGVVWRIYQETREGASVARKLVQTVREASPVVRLQPGEYFVNAAFGRAHMTRRISVKPGIQSAEPFILNAGGLRVAAVVGKGEAAPPNSVTYDIYSDERDQSGNRTKIMGGARAGVIVRLNSGIYHIVSTYGDANALAQGDVTVEAGKLTEATVTHAAAKVTFKLVTRAGGEALADTHWTVLDAQGETVKESAGALPTHTLAPGKYTAIAKSGGRTYRRDFAVQNGEAVHVEVVIQ
jgi:hypothetical protein